MSLVREANTLQLLCVASTVLIVIDEEPEPLDHGEEGVVRALTRAVLVLPRLLDADLVREQQLALRALPRWVGQGQFASIPRSA